MKMILMITTALLISTNIFAEDMKEGPGNCPNVDDGARTRACVLGDSQAGNKCVLQNDQKLNSEGKVIKK